MKRVLLSIILLGSLSLAYGEQEQEHPSEIQSKIPWPAILAILLFGSFAAIIHFQKTGTENNPCATEYWKQRDDASYTHSSSWCFYNNLHLLSHISQTKFTSHHDYCLHIMQETPSVWRMQDQVWSLVSSSGMLHTRLGWRGYFENHDDAIYFIIFF